LTGPLVEGVFGFAEEVRAFGFEDPLNDAVVDGDAN